MVATVEDPMIVEANTTYIEPGFSAIDLLEGNLATSVSGTPKVWCFLPMGCPGSLWLLQVNSNRPNGFLYTLTYTVADTSGNTQSATRRVRIVDTRPPFIQLNGLAELEHQAGQLYRDDGARAVDALDGPTAVRTVGDVPWRTTTVPELLVTLTYQATDEAGNSASATRKVTLIDSAPTITLNEPQTVSLPFGTVFWEPGFRASDIRDGDLTGNVSVTNSSTIELRRAGRYTLLYTVSDQVDNVAQQARVVNVEEFQVPETDFQVKVQLQSPIVLVPTADELELTLSKALDAFAFVLTRRIESASNDDLNELPDARARLNGNRRTLKASTSTLVFAARRRTDFQYMDANQIIATLGGIDGMQTILGVDVVSASSASRTAEQQDNTGAIVGVVVTLLLIAAIAAGVMYYRQHPRQKKEVAPAQRETVDMFANPLFSNTWGGPAPPPTHMAPVDDGNYAVPEEENGFGQNAFAAYSSTGESISSDPFAAYSSSLRGKPVALSVAPASGPAPARPPKHFGMPVNEDYAEAFEGYVQPVAHDPDATYDQPNGPEIGFSAALHVPATEGQYQLQGSFGETSEVDDGPPLPAKGGAPPLPSKTPSTDWGAPVSETLLEQAERCDGFAGPISRDESKSRLEPFAAGTYLIRYSANTSAIVLSFKSTATVVRHFPVEKLDGGGMKLDKTSLPAVVDLEMLLDLLKGGDEYLGIKLSAAVTSEDAEIYSGLSSSEVWYKGNMTRPRAEEALTLTPDGTFLVRKRGENSYAISLCHQHVVTHHLLAIRPGQPVLVNKKEQLSSRTLEETVVELSTNIGPKMPCLLVLPCDC